MRGGRRPRSACAIEVEGLRRRPPTLGGGLGLEFRVHRVSGLAFIGFRVQGFGFFGKLRSAFGDLFNFFGLRLSLGFNKVLRF